MPISLSNDVELAECKGLARADVVSAEASLPHELLSELSPASCGWLGSDSCARFILQATESFTSRPVFWTREQRGEEAASWLFFRHKLYYLRLTSHRFGSTFDPQVRSSVFRKTPSATLFLRNASWYCLPPP